MLWIDAATFAVSAAVVGLAIPGRRSHDRPSGGYFADLAEGVRFIRRDHLVLALALTGAGVNALGGALFAVVLPIYARDTFGSVTAFGLMAAGDGAGALGGALVYGAVGHRLPRRATLVGAFLVAGASVAALVATPDLAATVAVLAVSGIAIGPLNPLVSTLFQERIPTELRGRVFGTILAVANAAAPLGILAAGYLVEAAGLRAMLTGIAALLGLVALAVATTSTFREMDRPALGPLAK